MKDSSKTNQELIEEISALKQRIQGLEKTKTEREKASQALRESEENFRFLIENAPDAIYVHAEARFVYLNRAAADLFGAETTERLIGSSIMDRFDPYDHGMINKSLHDLYGERKKLPIVEQIYLRLDGSSVPVEAHAIPITYNDHPAALTFARDINDRKRAEEALRKSEEHFRTLSDITPLGMSIIDVDGRYEYVNPAFVNIFGYDLRDIPTGKEWFEAAYPDPDYRRKAMLDWKEDLRSCLNFQIKPRIYEVRCKEGDCRIILFRTLTLPTGKHFIIYEDITERQRAEEEKRGQQEVAERLAKETAALADIGRLIGSTLDIDEVYEQFASEARKLIPFDRLAVNMHSPHDENVRVAYIFGEAMSGRGKGALFPLKGSVSEVLARTRAGLYGYREKGQEIEEGFDNYAATVQEGLRSLMGVPLIYRDEVIGSLHFRSRTPNAYNDRYLRLAERIGTQIAGAIGSAKLFSDLKYAQNSLRESEVRFRGLFEQAAVGVAEIEMSTGRFFNVNRRLCEMVGRTEEELLATTFQTITHPDDLRLHEEKSVQLLTGKIDHYSLEKRYIRKEGESVWVNITVSPLWKQGEIPERNMIVVEDITDRKQSEEEKRSLEDRLQRSEKMEALGTLAGGVAHDLNNVLGVVVGYSELILDQVEKSSPLRRGLENVMNGGLKAAAIVDDLLTLARRGVQRRSILNLNKIVADFQKSPEFTNLSDRHPSVTIKTRLEPDLLNISGSMVHLGKTLYNLISNASEAMPKGGTVTIKTTHQYLDKPIQGYDQIQSGDYVVLSVSDTGEGISANDLKRIFEPFYTKKVMGRSGTGLGLAVVWGTVKDHNGYINVQSEEGEGSSFSLYFPVTREEITVEASSVPISEYRGQGESILVVDDVKEQRDLASGMLRTLNYIVSGVSSGEEAVAYLKEHEIDLLVLDMIMDPGMDGLDTYKSVLAIHPKQKAVIVSGFSESDRVKAARDLGAGAYLKKPYIKEKLGLAVRKELDRK